jgi:hypothetical protein
VACIARGTYREAGRGEHPYRRADRRKSLVSRVLVSVEANGKVVSLVQTRNQTVGTL